MDPTTSLGNLRFDPATGRLLRDGATVVLSARGVALLAALVRAQGQPVTKSDLMQAAWPDTFVEEGNLTVQIAVLRKALGPAPDGGDWIATLPRVGYRLVLHPAAPAMTVARPPRLGVVAFHFHGPAQDAAYLAAGMADEILNALCRFASFSSVALARPPGDIDPAALGRALDIDYVLTGSLRRDGPKLRLLAQLITCDSGNTLWSDRFEGTTDDIFAFEDQITAQVATHLEPLIDRAEIDRSRRQRPGSAKGYDIFLRCRWDIQLYAAEANAAAYAEVLEGLQAEPDNPQLLAIAAWSLGRRAAMGRTPLTPQESQLCGDFARRGIAVAKGDAYVLALCGFSLLHVAREYALALTILREALRLNPLHMVVVCTNAVGELHCGSLDLALEMFDRARLLNPDGSFAHVAWAGSAHVHMVKGNFALAYELGGRAVMTAPGFDLGHWMMIAAAAHLGWMDEARQHLARFAAHSPKVTLASIRTGQVDLIPDRMANILEGLRLAGLPPG